MAENVKNSADAEKRPDKIQDALSEQIVQIVARLAAEEGAHKVTAKQVINELGMANRVFYNRFSNIDEVLRIVYARSVAQTREAVVPDFTDKQSFIRFCMDAAEHVMISTYEMKMCFSRYVFEHDSLTEENRLWWKQHIIRNYESAHQKGYVKTADTEALCYAIWCFCRGYYADIAARELQKEEAVRLFRFGFRCLLDGILTPDDTPQADK